MRRFGKTFGVLSVERVVEFVCGRCMRKGEIKRVVDWGMDRGRLRGRWEKEDFVAFVLG